MLFRVCPGFWGFIVWWASQGVTEGNNQDICEGDKFIEELYVRTSSLEELNLELSDINETFNCFLYPTNVLNCSWSFFTLTEDTQLSVSISVCKNDKPVQTLRQSSVERAGSRSITLQDREMLYVILQFNMSLHDNWTLYTYTYDKDTLEVPPPPQNISSTVKDGGLLVSWALPHSLSNLQCFEFQLDLGEQQERVKQLTAQLSYTEASIDPTHTYKVRIRMRKLDICFESLWSEWSPTHTVERTVQPVVLNTLLIISMTFGIPMILLAVLLLVRHQRVSKLLFPPIPRPSPKYIYFLEKSDPFSFFHPPPSSKAEEEITQVEDAEENPGNTFSK